MKIFTTVLKIVAALAAIAGVVYVVATYGDKIVAWCKKMLGIDYCCDECCCEEDCCCDEDCCCGEECCCEELEEVDAEPAGEAAEEHITEQDFEGE